MRHESKIAVAVATAALLLAGPIAAHADTPADTVRPVAQRIAPTSDLVYLKSTDLVVKATDDIALKQITGNIYQDGKLKYPRSCAASGTSAECRINLGSLPGGVYSARINAVDAAGNVASTSTWGFTVDIDTARPVVELVSPTNSVLKSTASLNFRATDNRSLAKIVVNIRNAAGVLVKPNQVAVPAGTTTYDYAVPVASLGQGKFCARYNALDEAGNMSQTKEFCFTIDDTRPDVTLVSPTGSVVNKNAVIDILATDNVSLGRIIAHVYTGPCKSGGAFVNRDINTGLAGRTSAHNTFTAGSLGLADGVYCLAYGAYDEAGNQVNKTWQFTLDNVKPVVVRTAPDSDIMEPNGSISLKATDDVSLSYVTIHLYDGANKTLLKNLGTKKGLEGTKEATYTASFANLAEGKYCVRLGAQDEAGNIGVTTWCFTVKKAVVADTVAPTLTLTKPGTGVAVVDATTKVELVAKDDKALKEMNVHFYDASCTGPILAKKSLTGMSGTQATNAFVLGDVNLPLGAYCMKARVYDSAGNGSNTVVWKFTLGNGTTPTVTPTPVPTAVPTVIPTMTPTPRPTS